MIKPKKLRKDAKIVPVLPSGPLEDRERFYEAVKHFELRGYRVENYFFRQNHYYLSSDDRTRKDDLMKAMGDPEAGMIIGIRGGYGCSRIAPDILYSDVLNGFRTLFCGFSDLTTISLVLLKKGIVNLYGPMLSPDFGKSFSDFSFNFLQKTATGESLGIHRFCGGWKNIISGNREGLLTGGCLSLIQTSIGTDYEIETEGRILAFEDTGESPYRIDRMLTHLIAAGKFDEVQGVLVGRFSSCPDAPPTCEEVVAERLSSLKCPVLTGADFGHVRDKITLPLGTLVRLDSDRGEIEFLEKAVED
ncbi:LD-carboxypeptidase [candidate division WOR-3 bacterium]|nr:LD-carboxypeptidase [candidate division WOR-3 bacterium]